VQRFDTIVAGVERKLEVLQKLTERRAEEAVDLRARRISEGLSWLAALTVVTVTFTGIAYFFGARSFVSHRDAIRLWAVVIATLIAVALLLFAHVDRGRPARRGDRRRQ
jgi:cytochrome bd-type quinol oxidase subunit 2